MSCNQDIEHVITHRLPINKHLINEGLMRHKSLRINE